MSRSEARFRKEVLGLAHNRLAFASVLLTIVSKMEAIEIEATPTAVKLMPDERVIIREKAKARARQIGIRFMPISTFMRWAALNVDVGQDAIAARVEVSNMAMMEAA